MFEVEKAQIMRKLIRKNNWGAKYDRLEHFKRFPNLDEIIKELIRKHWIIFYKKPNYKAMSLNSEFKKEIIEFVESQLKELI
jgi:hypothetical protein